MSPILCFTASEAWDVLKKRDGNADLNGSIFFKDFPDRAPDYSMDQEKELLWGRLMSVRSEITRALENARSAKVIGHPLEAEVLVNVEGELSDFLSGQWQMIKEISIVSELTSVDRDQFEDLTVYVSEELEGLQIAIKPASGDKCERCWTRSESVGQNIDHPQICHRCSTVIDSINL